MDRVETKDPEQLAVMAAIVTTILLFPLGALLWLVAWLAFGVPLESFVGLGGTLHPGLGLVAWWAIFFAPAYLYAVLISS